MSVLAFFPWWEIEEPIRVGGYELLPFVRGEAPAGGNSTERVLLDRLLAPWCDLATRPLRASAGGSALSTPLPPPERETYLRPIGRATLLHREGESLTPAIAAGEERRLFEFAKLVAFAGLAGRQYFGIGIGYSNSDDFSFVVQHFIEPGGGTSVVRRRRDGQVSIGYSEGRFRELRPPHVNRNGRFTVDVALLRALVSVWQESEAPESPSPSGAAQLPDGLWRRIAEATEAFNGANRDSDQVSQQGELIAIVGSTQRLLGTGDKRDLLVAEVRRLFTAQLGETPPAGQAWPVDLWLRELCGGWRGKFAHGGLRELDGAQWGLKSHLLLVSFFFPLLVKLVLADAKRYELTCADRRDLGCFAEQVAADPMKFETDEHGEQRSPWNRIRSSAAMREAFREFEAS